MWTSKNRARYDRSKLRYPSDLTDDEWGLVEPLIPPGKSGGGKRTVIMREVVNGLMYILSTGCQWRAIPKDLPPKSSVYLNVYVPHLQSVGAVVGYLRVHRGQRFASTTAVTPMTEAFVRNTDQFVNHEGVDLIAFQKWQRKDDVTQKYLRRFTQCEGVLYVGKAQEKARVMRTERRRSRHTGGTYPWIVESTAMVNHYYFYCVDEDFGPFFLKFCSYFPYNAKLCINGHEYLKRQLAKRGVAFEALDNGV